MGEEPIVSTDTFDRKITRNAQKNARNRSRCIGLIIGRLGWGGLHLHWRGTPAGQLDQKGAVFESAPDPLVGLLVHAVGEKLLVLPPRGTPGLQAHRTGLVRVTVWLRNWCLGHKFCATRPFLRKRWETKRAEPWQGPTAGRGPGGQAAATHPPSGRFCPTGRSGDVPPARALLSGRPPGPAC